ncbi:hypothetical protein G5V59_11180 [Nocardioides sp. W3-2-3]|uniref:hypothetical protein n=1 Tax=Nocardioides convexus TaxID=2712224 RepID=UPI0024186092|nr:hypothetical protein [Nocardioides convexus]NHA00435.1 hypothetical protein [Nocardioides convexus]
MTLYYLAFTVLLAVYVVLWVLVVVVSPGAGPIVLWGIVTVPAFIALVCWLYTRLYYLAVPPLMLEGIGVFAAIERSLDADPPGVLAHLRDRAADPAHRQHRRQHAVGSVLDRGPGLGPGRPAVRRAPARAHPGGRLGDPERLHRPLPRDRDLHAVPRPAHAQGGLRRGACCVRRGSSANDALGPRPARRTSRPAAGPQRRRGAPADAA